MNTVLTAMIGVIQDVIVTFKGWINRLFGLGEDYSKKYSNIIVYIVLIWVLSKMLKIRITR